MMLNWFTQYKDSLLYQVIDAIFKKGVKYTYNRIFFIIFWFWFRDFPILVTIYNYLHPLPSYIEIEVTTRCGLRCIMCEHTYWKEPARDMSYNEFLTILDQFPHLKWIGLTGIGESFLNKDFIRMLKLVKSRGVYVELYDNLFFPTEDEIKMLVDLQVEKLLISLEAASAETYEKIRPGSDFDRVVSHIKRLFEYKKYVNSEYPKISFHFIVMKNNLNEIPQFIEMVSKLSERTAHIQISRMLHRYQEVQDLYTDINNEFIESCQKLAQEKGVKISWNLDVPLQKPPLTHCIEWTMPFIFATGHVVPCCSANESNSREFQKKNAMGNIFETPFKEIWKGRQYHNLRRGIRSGNCPPACDKCCLYKKV